MKYSMIILAQNIKEVFEELLFLEIVKSSDIISLLFSSDHPKYGTEDFWEWEDDYIDSLGAGECKALKIKEESGKIIFYVFGVASN